MKKQLGLALLLSLLLAESAFSQGAADRASSRLDSSRARSESRYGTVGNEPQTETVVRQKVITVTVPDKGGPKTEGFVALRAPPKKKRIVVQESVTVTTPRPARINPY
jgi:hypothetical protein